MFSPFSSSCLVSRRTEIFNIFNRKQDISCFVRQSMFVLFCIQIVISNPGGQDGSDSYQDQKHGHVRVMVLATRISNSE